MPIQHGEGADSCGTVDAGLQDVDVLVAAPPALHSGCAGKPALACSPVQDDGGKRLQEMGAA
eukprot:3750263-Alexandrium_andersonii.AAC.1